MSAPYRGSLLEVDLTTRRAVRRETPEGFLEQFLGGRGLGARLLWDVPEGTAADAPENPLIFCPGLLNGYPSPATPRSVLVTRSALTRPLKPSHPGSATLNMAGLGGTFGAELKLAGLDALVVKGRSDKPVVLVVDGPEVRFEDAGELWGLPSEATERALRKRLGADRFKTLYIGPAGERLVRFAGIVHEVTHIFARGGGGFVMGSKKLKAIALRGHLFPSVVDYPAWRSALSAARVGFKSKVGSEQYNITRYWSTLKGFGWLGMRHGLAVKNYREGIDHQMLDYHERARRQWVQENACYGCTVPCRRAALVKDGPRPGRYPEVARFESTTLLGSNVGVSDERILPALTCACTEVGLDTISMGNLIGFLIDAKGRGLLPPEVQKEIPGLDWGAFEPMLKLIGQVARREGIGDRLADGLARFVESLGEPAREIAFHGKGQEYAAWNPKGFWAIAVGYATSSRGACHLMGVSPAEQDNKAALDALGICHFTSMITGIDLYAPLVAALLGKRMGRDDLLQAGERIFNLERCLNLREGFSLADDLQRPKAIATEAIPEGPPHRTTLPEAVFQKMLRDYHVHRGWDPQTARPELATLERLGLGFAARP